MAITIPNPREDAYWDREALVAEEKRVFEICNGCRLCWNLCPSFPKLFESVDALDVDAEDYSSTAGGSEVDEHGGHEVHSTEAREDVLGQAEALEKLPLSVHQEVVDLCYQCKLCDPICPYVPPHEFAVDFPRLMLRHKAIDARQHGVKLQDRVLGDPDLIGRLGTLVPAFANLGSSLKLNRILMEATVGIHRDRQLPRFTSETFQAWWKKRHADRPDPKSVEGRKVVLFYTCSVQWNEPQVGRAAIEVLEHNGITVYAPELRCCGMPALDGGDVPRATAWARQNVEILLPYVEAGCDIVAPGPTCSYMIKHEWKDYLGTEQSEVVAARAYDLMEYLWNLRKEGALKDDYSVGIGEIGYHLACHLKVQKIGYRSRDILKKVPDTTIKMVDKCSCMDGTWGMKKEWYDLSVKGAQPLLEGMTESRPGTLASDCLIAKLQIEERTGQQVLHPIELLWKAYGGQIEERAQKALPAPATGDDDA